MPTVTLGASGTYTTGAALQAFMATQSLTEDLIVQVSNPTPDTDFVAFFVSAANGFKVRFVAASGFGVAANSRLWPLAGRAELRNTKDFPVSGLSYLFGAECVLEGIQVCVGHQDGGGIRMHGLSVGSVFYASSASFAGATISNSGSGQAAVFRSSLVVGAATIENTATFDRSSVTGNLRGEFATLLLRGSYFGSTQIGGGSNVFASGSHNATAAGSFAFSGLTNSQVNVPSSEFVNTTAGSQDLRIAAGATQLKNTGVVVAGVTTDFYGQPVPMGAAPDIGAHEFFEAPPAPTFSAHPQSLTRTVGQGASFGFTAANATSQQWQRNNGSGWADISGATSPSYTISAVQLTDNGAQFRVNISGPGGGPISSSPATLTVTAAGATGVTFAGPTSGTVGQASSNFTFGVTPVGSSITGTVVVTPNDNGGGGTWSPPTVSLTDAQPTGTSQYTAGSSGTKTLGCTNNGSLSNPATISFNASTGGVAPSVTQHPAAVSVVAGVNGGMTAAFSGTPTPSVQWQRSAAGGGSWANISGATSLTLSLSPTTVSGGTFNNGDQFRCVGTNASGSATTNAALLTVTAAPTGGTLTSTVLRRLNRTIHANKPFLAYVHSMAGALLLSKTGLTSSALGVCSFQDAALSQAQQVQVTWVRTDTGERAVEVLTVS